MANAYEKYGQHANMAHIEVHRRIAITVEEYQNNKHE
jgi:hypothetical protein